MTLDAEPDTDFVADRIEDALDGGTVDNYAREHLLSALAECDPALARKRRDGERERPQPAGKWIDGP